MTEPVPCLDDDLLVGLSLGHLTGRQRAGALIHLGACTVCRAKVLDLVEVAEQLLLATPPAEPPAGFEAEVLSAMTHEPPPPDPVVHHHPVVPPRLRRPILVAAAALLVVVVGLGAFALTQRTPATAEAAMVTDSGRDVGTAWRHEDDPSWVFVSVPRWDVWEEPGAEPLRYTVTAELDDGTTTELGSVEWSAGGSWGTTTSIDAARITSVAVVDHTGKVWCRGEF